VENKTDYAACLKNTDHFLLHKHTKWISRGVFPHSFAYANAGLLRV